MKKLTPSQKKIKALQAEIASLSGTVEYYKEEAAKQSMRRKMDYDDLHIVCLRPESSEAKDIIIARLRSGHVSNMHMVSGTVFINR